MTRSEDNVFLDEDFDDAAAKDMEKRAEFRRVCQALISKPLVINKPEVWSKLLSLASHPSWVFQELFKWDSKTVNHYTDSYDTPRTRVSYQIKSAPYAADSQVKKAGDWNRDRYLVTELGSMKYPLSIISPASGILKKALETDKDYKKMKNQEKLYEQGEIWVAPDHYPMEELNLVTSIGVGLYVAKHIEECAFLNLFDQITLEEYPKHAHDEPTPEQALFNFDPLVKPTIPLNKDGTKSTAIRTFNNPALRIFVDGFLSIHANFYPIGFDPAKKISQQIAPWFTSVRVHSGKRNEKFELVDEPSEWRVGSYQDLLAKQKITKEHPFRLGCIVQGAVTEGKTTDKKRFGSMFQCLRISIVEAERMEAADSSEAPECSDPSDFLKGLCDTIAANSGGRIAGPSSTDSKLITYLSSTPVVENTKKRSAPEPISESDLPPAKHHQIEEIVEEVQLVVSSAPESSDPNEGVESFQDTTD